MTILSSGGGLLMACAENGADEVLIRPMISFDIGNVKPGDSFNMELILSNIKGVEKTNSVIFNICYDNEAFELLTGDVNLDCRETPNYISFDKSNQVYNNGYNIIRCSFMNQVGDVKLIDNLKLFSISFKVKSGAVVGEKAFTLLPVNVIDSNFKVYSFNNGLSYSQSLLISSSAAAPTSIGGGGGGGGGGLRNIEATPIHKPTPTVSPISTPVPTISPLPTKIAPAVDANAVTSGNINNSNKRFPAGASFVDLKDHWAEKYVTELFAKDIITGYPDGTIKPDKDITRAEAAVVISVANKLSLDDTLENNVEVFADYKEIPTWASKQIRAATKKGIISGYTDRTFKPNKKVTRAELISMIDRAFGYKKANIKNLIFIDSNNIPLWAKDSISLAVDAEIIKGYPDGSFGPNKNITRAEMFTVLGKALNQKMTN